MEHCSKMAGALVGAECGLGWAERDRYGSPFTVPARRLYPSLIFTCYSLAGHLTDVSIFCFPAVCVWGGGGAQISSALAWAQIAIASDYTCMVVMRPLHKAVCHVYSVSPWSAENTMRLVYAIAHHQPCTRHHVATQLLHWLRNNALRNTAKWHEHYTDPIIPPVFQPEECAPAWCADIQLLRACTKP